MDILLRGVDPSAVTKIDELAKKRNMSRNEFLKTQLHNMAILEELKILENRYIELTKTMSTIINDNTAAFGMVLQVLEKGE